MTLELTENSATDVQHLKKNAVGSAGIVFFVVSAAAPLTVVVGVPGVVFGLAGNYAAALGFLVAGIVLGLFSVGYAAMSNHISGPGGFAVYVEMAFGRRLGGAAAYIALIGYGGFLIGIYGFFGYLAAPDFKTLGLSLPWWAWTFVCMAVVGAIGYRAIDLSAKIVSVLLCCEVTIVLIMDIAILAHGGHSGLSVSGFSVSQLFHSSPGVVLLFAVASFVGFEATTLYGEEARDRHVTIPRATYIAVVVITAFYVFTFWLLGVAYGGDVIKVALASPGTFTFDAAHHYAGHWVSTTMSWLVLSSIFACLLAFHNGIARYLFALGRSGLMAPKLGLSHGQHESPYVASVVTSALAVVLVGICVVLRANPYVQMYALMCGFGTVAMLVLYACGSLSVLGYLRRKGLDKRLWHSLVAPILGTAGLIVMIYLSIANFSALTGSSNTLVNLLWLLPFIAAVIGYIVAAKRWHSTPLGGVSEGLSGESGAGEPDPVGQSGVGGLHNL